MDRKGNAFRWWWPQSTGGTIAFTVLLTLAACTIVRGPLFWVNVIFWYFVAVGARLLYSNVKLMSSNAAPTDRATENPVDDASDEE